MLSLRWSLCPIQVMFCIKIHFCSKVSKLLVSNVVHLLTIMSRPSTIIWLYIYIFDVTVNPLKRLYLYLSGASKKDRHNILTTKGGSTQVKRIIHIPCDWNDLQKCLTKGLHTADMGQSADIFFESTRKITNDNIVIFEDV